MRECGIYFFPSSNLVQAIEHVERMNQQYDPLKLCIPKGIHYSQYAYSLSLCSDKTISIDRIYGFGRDRLLDISRQDIERIKSQP